VDERPDLPRLQAAQGGGDAGLFPLLLVFVSESLQAATTAMVRKDAGGPPPPRRGTEQALQMSLTQSLGPSTEAHQQAVTRQTPCNDYDFAIKATQALALAVEIGDGERDGFGWRHRREVQFLDPIGSLAELAVQRGVTPDGDRWLWALAPG
jgi:hypothetical protein